MPLTITGLVASFASILSSVATTSITGAATTIIGVKSTITSFGSEASLGLPFASVAVAVIDNVPSTITSAGNS